MAFNYPNLSADQLDTWSNGLLAKLKSIINAFPGANLVNSSVSLNKLAKQRARGTWSFCFSGTLVNANVATLFSRTILNSDGAAATYQIVGWSVSVNKILTGTTLTGSASASLTFHKNGGAAFLTIPIDTGTALAIGTPLSSDLSGAPLSIASGDILTCNYNWATTAGASYPGVEVHLDWTLPHAGT